MKFLIDEMYPPVLAQRLRDERIDAVSVHERSDLRGHPDVDVFDAAQREGRAVVTENVPDYLLVAREQEAAGGVHHGLVLTTNKGFPRARPDTVSQIVEAIVQPVAREVGVDPDVASNRVIWL